MFELQENDAEDVKGIFFIPQERKDSFKQVFGKSSFVGTTNQIKSTSIHSVLMGQGFCCYSTHGLKEHEYFKQLDENLFQKWNSRKPIAHMKYIRDSLEYMCNHCYCLFNSDNKMGFVTQKQV
jgi:hypothetical protein